ncbi:MAG: phosphopantetheine-binding protein [Acidobacteria bacterium]|nr:phosphopantetheine-binding protein [Acidobacteriota bacterium]
MTREEIKETLREMIVQELRLEEITPEEVGDDLPLTGARLGFDSIDILELIVAIERRFGVRIRDGASAARALESVNALADFVLVNTQEKLS